MDTCLNIEIAAPFRELFLSDKHFVMLKGGRTSGKTVVAGQLITIYSSVYPNRDMIVCRDSFSDLRDSTFQEIQSWIEEYGLSNDYVPKLNPMRIYNKRTHANIYFMGIGGADKHRTKSFKPKNPIIAVLFEELQQVRELENLEQAHSSFRRFLDTEHGKFIHCFNPEPQNAHWVNVYWNLKVNDPDWLCIYSTYMDICKYLNDIDLKEILKMKRLDEGRYRWLYLGETGGGYGSIYPQFKRNKHLLTFEEAKFKFRHNPFVGLIIGVDGAVTHDCTALVPIAILRNGQALVLDIFCHDPLKSQVLSSTELVTYIRIWYDELLKKYSINYPNDIPIMFVCDSASTDLRINLDYHFGSEALVVPYKKPTIHQMVGNVQSVIAKNMVYVVDYGGHQDYFLNKWIATENLLATQLENLIWDEKQKGYDPIVPNDVSDAFTYGINNYFKNPDNVYWLENLIRFRQDYYDVEGE